MMFNKMQQTFSFRDFAKTDDLSDINEVGFFGRYWLMKEHFSGVPKALLIFWTVIIKLAIVSIFPFILCIYIICKESELKRINLLGKKEILFTVIK